MEFMSIDLSTINQQNTVAAIDSTQAGTHGLAALLAKIKQWDAGAVISVIYWLILAAFMSYFGLIYIRINRATGTLARVNDPAILQRVEKTRQMLGISRSIAVFQSESDLTPWTWGIFQPRIILPPHFSGWTEEQQQNVLIHELSHIKRIDLISFLLVRVCCCLYWFHPLAWLGYRKMITEAEKACDDRVLLNGSKASFYATQLMDIANALYGRHRQQPLVAAMARCSSLTSRVRNILDSRLSRNLIRNHVLTLTVVISFALLISLVSSETIAEIPDQGTVVTNQKKQEKIDQGQQDGSVAMQEGSEKENKRVAAMREVIYKKLSEVQGLVEAGKHDQGLSMLKELDARTDLSPYERAQVQNFLAYSYFSMDRYDDAIQSYEQVLIQPDLPKALELNSTFTLAQLYFMQQNYKEAVARMNQWMAMSDSPTVNSYIFLGQAYYNQEQYKNALVPLQKAYELVKKTGAKPKLGLLQLTRAVYQNLEDKEGFDRVTGELKKLYPEISGLDITDSKPVKARLTQADGDYLPIVKVAPVYPKRALARKLEGYVVVEFTVTTRGTTKDIKVVEAKPIVIFNQAAIQAAEKFKYKPRVVDGKPVEVHGVRNKIAFKLDKQEETN